MHTGECELRDGRLIGPALEIAAGVARAAAPGEILATSTVADLVAGSGIEFYERGTSSSYACSACCADWSAAARRRRSAAHPALPGARTRRSRGRSDSGEQRLAQAGVGDGRGRIDVADDEHAVGVQLGVQIRVHAASLSVVKGAT